MVTAQRGVGSEEARCEAKQFDTPLLFLEEVPLPRLRSTYAPAHSTKLMPISQGHGYGEMLLQSCSVLFSILSRAFSSSRQPELIPDIQNAIKHPRLAPSKSIKNNANPSHNPPFQPASSYPTFQTSKAKLKHSST